MTSEPSDSAAELLVRTLLETPLQGVAAGDLLAALGHVAPESCLRLLTASGDRIARIVSAGDLSKAACAALRPSAVEPGGRRHYALELLRQHGPALAADATAAALSALGSADADAVRPAARRFPKDAALLRAAIGVLRHAAEPELLDELLGRLGRADPTPATLSFVTRLRPPEVTATLLPVRAAFVSSFTIDHLVPFVDLASREVGLRLEPYVAPFNSWTSDVIDEASGLRRFDPEIVFLSVSIDDLIPQLAGPLDAGALEAAGVTALERVAGVAERFSSWAGATPLVVHAFHSAFGGTAGALEGRDAASRRAWLAGLNGKLGAALRALPACYLLDVEAAVIAGGGKLADNPKLRHIAAMRLPPDSLAGVADAYARYLAPLKGLGKKCIVLDLDNTLWGGVVGEDSKDGLRLGNTSPGSEFVEFQQFLSSLPARGIMLALNSKNNPEDALEAIRTHEAMLLRESSFSALRINWKPKHENMISIAEELNVGVDSLIFVDDNPDEREQMRQMLPDVLTVDLPKDPALYRSVLERLPELQSMAVTSEDRMRAGQYRTARLRDEAKAAAGSIGDYLRSLDIEIEIGAAAKPLLPRIAQLFAKTNQFNVTTRRYDAAALERFATSPFYRLYALKSRDRFGDHGLVAVALVRVAPESWEIDSFLMSCRVIGYGIESALLAHVAERARASGAGRLVGEFIESKKNAPAKDLYARHGFEPLGGEGDVERWHLPAGVAPAAPDWTRVTRDDA